MLVLQDESPPCFEGDLWSGYLLAVRAEAATDDALRRRLERGGLPRYCADCKAEHQAAMELQGRCFPQKERRREP